MRLITPSPSFSTKDSKHIKAPLLHAVAVTGVTSWWQGSPPELRCLRVPLKLSSKQNLSLIRVDMGEKINFSYLLQRLYFPEQIETNTAILAITKNY